jgi:hypothetical protein
MVKLLPWQSKIITRGEKKMKSFFGSVFFLLAMVGAANAAPAKFVNATVSCDGDGNVTIATMPSGTTLVAVEIYDDIRGTKPRRIGATSSFKLEPGQGFNFIWKDLEGSWYQMITPQSKVPAGLAIDASWIDPQTGQPACKYLFPLK